jgi:hypothetical protein
LAAKGKAASHRVALFGQIANPASSGFTLTWTPKAGKSAGVARSLSVVTSPTTKERAAGGATAVAAGEYAFVVGTRSKGTVTARRVVFSTSAFTARQRAALRGVLVRGTVVSSAGDQLTVSVGKNARTVTFTLTGATKYRVSREVSTTAPTFTAGQKVIIAFTRAKGTTAGTKTFVATRVVVPAKQS